MDATRTGKNCEKTKKKCIPNSIESQIMRIWMIIAETASTLCVWNVEKNLSKFWILHQRKNLIAMCNSCGKRKTKKKAYSGSLWEPSHVTKHRSALANRSDAYLVRLLIRIFDFQALESRYTSFIILISCDPKRIWKCMRIYWNAVRWMLRSLSSWFQGRLLGMS